ncbi:MAG: hypothetical protein PHD48_11295 [Alphaproteobacteria bacterium]|nr:hypothetical protein [Alphaproteobacteria bacterium]
MYIENSVNFDRNLTVRASCTQKMWEGFVDGHEKFVRITQDTRDYFSGILAQEKRLDSYLSSLTYFSFTGRYGLWVYEDKGTCIPLCWHPNIPGQILIFPMMGKKTPQVLTEMLESIPQPPQGVRLARLSPSDLTDMEDGSLLSQYSYIPAEEKVLDWTYPVRILSTERVAHLDGHIFKRVRNRIRHAEQLGFSVRPLTEAYADKIKDFILGWALARSDSAGEIHDFTSPYYAILDGMRDPRLRLDGLVFLLNHRVQAFTAWDTPANGMSIANRFANLCNENILGLSDFVMQTVARELHNRNIQLLNLGGSETKGLDDYKAKFVPEFSLKLCSAEIEVAGLRSVPTRTLTKNRGQAPSWMAA